MEVIFALTNNDYLHKSDRIVTRLSCRAEGEAKGLDLPQRGLV